MKKCIICGHATPTIVRADYPGYVEGINFDIISCGQCNTHFISPIEVDPQIYELVYSDTSIAGYDRYFAYANSVKSKSDPLDFLAQSECTYYAVASFLKGKTGKKILEVGCGYGYLTYSMNQNGHQTTGIDSSAKAISFARQNLGDCFHNETLESFSKRQSEKFDVIVSTEVIEHLSDPFAFISTCSKLLNPGGAIVLTTPSKNFFEKGSVWISEPPPVHTVWLSQESFKSMASQLKLDLEFVDYRRWSSGKENQLLHYLLTRKEPAPVPVLTRDGKPNSENWRVKNPKSRVRQIFKAILVNCPPVVKLSNAIYYLLGLNGREFPQIGVVLKKK